MEILFIGHVAKDINKTPNKTVVVPGGGVFYGSIAAQRIGANCRVVTKCAIQDRFLYDEMLKIGTQVSFLESETTTAIENFYPTENPDDRISRVLSLANRFQKEDIKDLSCEKIVLSALWHGEFVEELIPVLRDKAKILIGDAQGFLRNVVDDGQLRYQDWPQKNRYLKLFDVFKVDNNEAYILTGERDLKKACEQIHSMGVKIVLATHKDGVCAYDGVKFYEAKFLPYKLEGRTGRGDTCLATFTTVLDDLKMAVQLAADVTSKKMQYPGPYKG
ncbi:PfkB family carbohydrate kinase [Thermotoga profunda]|uniref:PfkB family carbohydrate kinase n=1 Tax=Thermotoga profunda TaxID=1508420 RepID=UPI0005977BD3|nr:PfkB family carbohydrate kinase [Thermotoga profunda]